jgi:hypothetical protein
VDRRDREGFASAAAQSSDGGLSKRMFGSLLTWMQEHAAPVFLVATANDIEALPPSCCARGGSTRSSSSICRHRTRADNLHDSPVEAQARPQDV